jgi:hypothetical protein
MLRTVEVPRERWLEFLQVIQEMALGRPIRLEVASRELGDQDMAERLPLLALALETKGSARGDLIIAVGSDRGELTHVIEQPKRMAVGLNESNEPQWLALDEAGEAATIIHFERLPALESEYAATT